MFVLINENFLTIEHVTKFIRENISKWAHLKNQEKSEYSRGMGVMGMCLIEFLYMVEFRLQRVRDNI